MLKVFYGKVFALEESMKKLYRAITLDTNHDDDFGFEFLIAVLAEVKFFSTSAEGSEIWGFSHDEGETFLILLDTALANDILSNPEEDIELDLLDFKLEMIHTNEGLINAYIYQKKH